MADYRDHYKEIREAGANVVAVSVDAPNRSEKLRRELSLPFAILSDTGRGVVQEWNVYNPREKGGIAKPAVFVIGQDHKVRYAAVDTVSTRVPASEIIGMLRSSGETQNVQRRHYLPRFGDWFRAIRNAMQKG